MKEKYSHLSSTLLTALFLSLIYELYAFSYPQAILDLSNRPHGEAIDFGMYAFNMIYVLALFLMAFFGEKRLRIYGIIIFALSLVRGPLAGWLGIYYIMSEAFLCYVLLTICIGDVSVQKRRNLNEQSSTTMGGDSYSSNRD